MSAIEILMPSMGEGIVEATLIQWFKNEGDVINIEENLIEVATDKVNSEVPSSSKGILVKKLYKENDVIPVGKPFAIVSADGNYNSSTIATETLPEPIEKTVESLETTQTKIVEEIKIEPNSNSSNEDVFYSPLVLNIAKEEGISLTELASIGGTGLNNRVTKNDILTYLKTRSISSKPIQTTSNIEKENNVLEIKTEKKSTNIQYGGNVEIVEMDRMRKLIADYMIKSKQTSAHVTSFVEVDMTNIVSWRNKMKNTFKQKYGENLTFMPIFIEAVVKALKDFPIVNSSVDGDNIIIKKDINVGLAAALPSGNLIVPVIKNTDQLNLLGLCKQVNDLATRARANKLKPDEIQGGTYTISNLGTFGNLLGTPIINQPQVAILAVGAIVKRPVVIEKEDGDYIGIRSMMYLSHSYDHRVIDGYAGGSFVKRVAEYLEAFDIMRDV